MISRKRLYAVLSVLLGLSVVGAAVAVAVTTLSQVPGEPYTEFYLLGPGGKAAGYPSGVTAGEEQTVTVGIVSHEPKITTYRVEVEADGQVIARAGPLVIAPLDRYEQPLGFTLEAAGDRQKVTFLLYREGQPDAYRSVYLWVDVSPPPP
jgi:uncharacterized membrane protein